MRNLLAHPSANLLGRELRGSNDLAGFNARGADVQALGGLANQGTNSLDIGIPATLGASVRVRNIVPEAWALSADIAVCSHGGTPQVSRRATCSTIR